MKRILCYGDSNTWGHDPETDGARLGENYRWPSLLQKKLGDKFCVIEEGLCGRTTAFDNNFDIGWNGYQYFIPCFHSQSPLDLVIIMLGTNDLQILVDKQPEQVGVELEKYIEYIHTVSEEKNDTAPDILFISPIAIDKSITQHKIFNEIYGTQSIEKSKRLAPVVELTAKKCGVHFLRGEDFAVPSKLDGLHMDKANHALFADAVYNAVIKILK